MKKRSLPWTALTFSLVIVGLLVFIGRSVAKGPGTTPTDADRKVAARTAIALGGARDERVELPRDGSLVGGNAVVEPAQPETKVAAQLSGKIARVLVAEGDRVEAGAQLVVMESRVEAAAASAAQADVDTAKATFARVAHGNRAEDVEAALADAASARAKAENSADFLVRSEKLAQGGASTADDLDKAKHSAAADAAAFRASEARAKAMIAGSRYEDVAEARARVVAAEARRDEAVATLDRLTVVAPISATVLRVKYRAGEYYNPGSTEPLLILGDTRKLRVRMDVDERDVAKVKPDAKGFVVADAWKGRRFDAHIVEIARRMGRQNVRTDDPIERIDTKILEVVLELDDASTLVPGLRVTAYVQGAT